MNKWTNDDNDFLRPQQKQKDNNSSSTTTIHVQQFIPNTPLIVH